MICLTICAHSGKETETEHCEECYTTCCDCDEPVLRDERKTSNGDDYCESCYDERFTTCTGCEREIEKDDCKSSDSGEYYCQNCYDERFTTCTHCDCEIDRDECSASNNGDDYCESCHDDIFTHCENCGCELVRGDADYYNDYPYCRRCLPEGWDEEYFSPDDSFSAIGSTRKFGVELETSKCPDYEELRGQTVFGCKNDGSIDGKEFVSPILWSDAGLAVIEDFCDQARGMGFEVDAKCGYHLHLNLRGESVDAIKRVAIAYRLTESLWQSFVPRSRRENHFCESIPWTIEAIQKPQTMQEFREFVDDVDRYKWANLAAFCVHGTIEIRLHTSTLDGNKVTNWVKAHARFIDWVVATTDEEVLGIPTDLTEQFGFLCNVWADETLADFYAERAKTFGTVLEALEVA